MKLERLRYVCEIAALLLTGAALVVAELLKAPRAIAAGVCLAAWACYVAGRVARDRSALNNWGLRRDNVRAAAWRCLPVLLVGVAGMAAFRLARGWRPLPASAALVFALYPIWGLAQQLLVQGIFVGNLRRLGVKAFVIVPVGAALFGMAHAPDWPLAGLCVAAGAVWTALYLWTPNLFPLALSHGWLGALAYYWVLERDAIEEALKRLT